MFEKIQNCLEQIRQTKPLILNVTNYVTMDFMANSLLALGAAPVMSEDPDELEELGALARSINLNIGTLNPQFLERARALMTIQNKPMILDPVGAGATHIRTKAALEFLPYARIVRGNASEIMALTASSAKTLGVESTHVSQQALNAAQTLSKQYNLVVAISGATDIVVNKTHTQSLCFGSPLMQYITGMGCTLTAVIATFHAVESDPFQAALLGTTYFGLCGEQAAHKSNTPGSFKTAFLDSLYDPDLNIMREKLC
ncbi:MAG: hydroxyethylthiazole kinase [Proteobacteria bacterium]|nr:hydroxyethylthiazole kinase [Pseudomonadota bacterium]